MEAVLELSQTRLSHRRDIVEGILRSKRTDFEAKYVILIITLYIKLYGMDWEQPMSHRDKCLALLL